jgi:hypothetical protein
MGIEGDYDAAQVPLPRPRHEPGEEILVAPMNAVEGADGDDGASLGAWKRWRTA